MKRFQLYYFSSKSLSFIEARWFKTKVTAVSMALGMIMVVAGFFTNLSLDDFLGLGLQRNQVLVAENTVLRDQLKTIGGRLQSLQSKLATLSDQGNELRLLVDLPKLDSDTRSAGFGGTDDKIDLGVSGNVNRMLNDLRLSMSKAEKEIQLQQTNYTEVSDKYEHNKAMYACMPAIKPMEGYYSIHSFGMRMHPVFHEVRMHEGLDIANDIGTPVHATGDGVIEAAGRTEAGLGIMVVVNHGFGYTSVYGHLSKVLVRPGDRVKRGAVIALSGKTGIATGPHLHYEVRLNGVLQNPVDFFLDDVDYKKIKEQLASDQ
ncbi:MAG TPA: peptidoglycan DD-metalloendopeptidase family protein [Bacteroidota bacterium]|nr:peptidoglycan DD-metalloendopeptidase family protein [Bacteroidota bacterium]